MKRSVVVGWSLIVVAMLLAVAGGVGLATWWLRFDRSIELSEHFGNVENGSAYDWAVVELAAKKLVVPHDAVVRRTADPGKARLFMRKTLAFRGHPPEPMSLRGARQNMGCAVKPEEGVLLIATFGEWDSRIEGGTHMRLVVVVPEGVEVEQRPGLSGPDSPGWGWHRPYLTKPRDAKGGYWYGPASPAEGWTAVPDRPDPERTAQ